MKPRMHLAIDVSWTQVETTWREPGARVDRHYPDVGLFEDIARVAERGLIDLIFFGDSTGIPNTWKNSIDDAVRYGVAWPRLDMSPWITAMSRLRANLRVDVHAPLLRRASFELARPHHGRAHCL